MKNDKGFTLLEVIIAILFLSIVALSAVPAFYTQFKLMSQTKDITIQAFDLQGQMEREIVDARQEIIKQQQNINPSEEFSLFGKKAKLSTVDLQISDNTKIYAYLSQELAFGSLRVPPQAEDVWIQVDTDPNDTTAQLDSVLKGTYNITEGESYYFTSIYRWYVSRKGIIEPQFPQDYIVVSSSVILHNLERYQNRYVLFAVTPVDAYGVMGQEVASQRVYIGGESWEDGEFPWVDMDGNGIYQEGIDVKLEVEQLKTGLNTLLPFYDQDLNNIDISGGDLYVPQNIQLKLGEDQEISWHICGDINTAAEIIAKNQKDITIVSRTGNINLVTPLNDAKGRIVTQGDIILDTNQRGSIIIQDWDVETQGKISIEPKGRFTMTKSNLKGSGINIDTTQMPIITGNRSILIENSNLELHNNDEYSQGKISISTTYDFKMPSGSIIDTGSQKGYLVLQVGGVKELPPQMEIEILE